MGKHMIELTVTFTASYRGDEFVPFDETTAVETVSLTFPAMDEKYVVFPKILEGATNNVIAAHRGKMSDWWSKELDRKKKEEERRRMFAFENGGGLPVSVDTKAIFQGVKDGMEAAFPDVEITFDGMDEEEPEEELP